MNELFDMISEASLKDRGEVLTVLDGDCAGQKAVFSDGSLIWESKIGGFFSSYQERITGTEVCGWLQLGENHVFCDPLGKEQHLVICGGGHVSMPVIQIGVMLGWHVTVLEDRPTFADHARQAGAQEVICQPFAEALDQIEGNDHTYFVVLTRGHRYDQICLEKIVTKKHAYIGMIGSRRRSAMVRQNLIDKGCDREILDRVSSPIGLAIGAETPEEIGVAIMAEIIERKNQKIRTSGYPEDILEAIRNQERFPGRKVLVTIVSRKGSAPRGMGAKMLVCSDGRTVGTIGGGCMEAEIQQKALLMIREAESDADVEKGTESNTRAWKLCHADLLNEDAEEEGMVCGGTVEVLLETV